MRGSLFLTNLTKIDDKSKRKKIYKIFRTNRNFLGTYCDLKTDWLKMILSSLAIARCN